MMAGRGLALPLGPRLGHRYLERLILAKPAPLPDPGNQLYGILAALDAVEFKALGHQTADGRTAAGRTFL